MGDPLAIIGAIAALIALTKLSIGLASGLTGISRQCITLVQHLQSFINILAHVEQEFKRTLQIIASQSGNVGLDAASDLLQDCIAKCTRICKEYLAVLYKISKSRCKVLRWHWYKSELAILHGNLEGSKINLIPLLTSIRQSGDNHARAGPPPSYRAATHRDVAIGPGLRALAGWTSGASFGGTVGALGGPVGAFCGGMLGGAVGAIVGLVAGFENEDPGCLF